MIQDQSSYKIMKKYYGKSKLFNLIKPTRIAKTIKIDYKKIQKIF